MLSTQRHSHEVIRRLVNRMVADVLEHTRARIAQLRVVAPDNIRQLDAPLVAFSPAMDQINRSVKSFLMKNMYRHYKVNRMSSKARRVVRELFAFFIHEPNCLPSVWYAQTDGPHSQRTAEVIADYISGMTDRYALEEHARLFDVGART